MKKYIKNYSTSLISLMMLTGCATQPTYNPYNLGVTFHNSKPYQRPFLATSVSLNSDQTSILRDLAGVTFCEEGEILWTYQPNFKKGIFEFWNNTYQEANLASRTYGTLDAKKEVWQKFGNTINDMRQNGTAGCSHPMTDQEYNYFMTQQNNQRYETQQNSTANANTITQGLNGLTNQLNTINNHQNMQNQQIQQQSQTYWQNQETNSQLKKLNNNLNGLRYGY